MRIRIVLLVMSLLAATPSAGWTAERGAPIVCDRSLHRIAGPSFRSGAEVSAISGTSPTDVWIAGNVGIEVFGGVTDLTRGYVARWTGASWQRTRLPNAKSVAPIDLLAINPNDAWLVAKGRESSDRFYHWDGQAWSVVPAPVGHVGLVAIAGTSGDDVWAVGEAFDRVSGQDGVAVLRYRGQSWERAPAPTAPQGRQEEFRPFDIAVGRHGPLIVGSRFDPEGEGVIDGLAARWEAGGWVEDPLASPVFSDLQLTAVSDDGWAVGSLLPYQSNVPTVATYFLSDGRAGKVWSAERNPSTGFESMTDVESDPRTSAAWAVGTREEGTADPEPVVWRFVNATDWFSQVVPVPEGGAALAGIEMLGRATVMIVGTAVAEVEPYVLLRCPP